MTDALNGDDAREAAETLLARLPGDDAIVILVRHKLHIGRFNHVDLVRLRNHVEKRAELERMARPAAINRLALGWVVALIVSSVIWGVLLVWVWEVIK